MNRKKLHPSEADLKSSIYSWIDATDKPPNSKVDIVPEGWMTMKQMAEYKGIPITTMNSRIERHLKAGTVQKKEFFVKNGRCHRNTLHYYFK
jgi:hypothetical protein